VFGLLNIHFVRFDFDRFLNFEMFDTKSIISNENTKCQVWNTSKVLKYQNVNNVANCKHTELILPSLYSVNLYKSAKVSLRSYVTASILRCCYERVSMM